MVNANGGWHHHLQMAYQMPQGGPGQLGHPYMYVNNINGHNRTDDYLSQAGGMFNSLYANNPNAGPGPAQRNDSSTNSHGAAGKCAKVQVNGNFH